MSHGALVVLCGTSFSGKTTVAQAINDRLGAVVVSLDAINLRRGLHSGQGVAIHEWQRTHETARAEARSTIEAGGVAVIDDTSSPRFLRDGWRALAEDLCCPFTLVHVDTDRDTVLRRRAENLADPSRPDVRDEVLAEHLDGFEPPGEDERAVVVHPADEITAWVDEHVVPAGPGAFPACVVFLLGYPGVGKRTVGTHLAERLDGVLVDNQLINLPLLTLLKWDGKFPLPEGFWDRVVPIRNAVLGTIEDLAPTSTSYVFTNVLLDDAAGADAYARVRSLARRRGSLFLSVVLDCDPEEQVRRIDTPDRIARLKGSDPEGYRRHRLQTTLFRPPADEVLHLDTTGTDPRRNAEKVHDALIRRGLGRAVRRTHSP